MTPRQIDYALEGLQERINWVAENYNKNKIYDALSTKMKYPKRNIISLVRL